MSETAEERPLVFVKLGGSLITDKRCEEVVRKDTLARLAREVVDVSTSFPGRIVLGHGSGSFGHVAARRLDFDPRRDSSRRQDAISEIQDAAARLHRHVVEALLEAGGAPFSIVPGSAFAAAEGAGELVAIGLPERVLRAGLLPVVYGDVVPDSDLTATILPTEELFSCLIRYFLAQGRPTETVLWLGETAGVLNEEGQPIAELSANEADDLARTVGGAAGSDVTGGMRLRLETASQLARLGVTSRVLDGREPGILERVLHGDSSTGTTICSGSP